MKEQDIQYREQLFSIFADNTDDVFLLLNKDSYTVEYVTPNVNRILGISEEQVRKNIKALGKASYINGKPLSYEDLENLQSKQSLTLESERTHKETGEKKYFYETVYRAYDGKSDKYIVVLADRTKDRQSKYVLEEALEIANAANKAKSNFLNNISHDIRTPMNAIVGLTALLTHDASNQGKVKEYSRKITASSQYLLGLINDVLDMSKIESGKVAMHVMEMNLADLIDELGTIIRPQAKAKQQQFDIFMFHVTEEHLLGDSMRINQILINILSNAVKYTPEGGKIEMRITQLSQKLKGFARFRFEIQDTGIGMPKEFLKIIFEPFAREVNSMTNKIQGTGLGMPITKNLVELMGGTIDVKSIPGMGSTFTVELELRIQEKTADNEFWKKNQINQILVVDDDEIICTNIVRCMENTGVGVHYTLNGNSAIKLIMDAYENGVAFDVVLLDWKMLDIDGIQTAKRIRAVLPEHIPIILLTAYEWNDIKEEAMEAGIDGFLAKPFFLTNFKSAISRIRAIENTVPAQTFSTVVGSELNVLAAEDNELNSEILVELLRMSGVSCDVAENGKELLEMFEKSKPDQYDLILSDIQMPVMNGYEAARAIRTCRHPRAKTIPIIAMTANAFAKDVKDALDAGMDAHISKPIDMKRLETVIADLLNRIE